MEKPLMPIIVHGPLIENESAHIIEQMRHFLGCTRVHRYWYSSEELPGGNMLVLSPYDKINPDILPEGVRLYSHAEVLRAMGVGMMQEVKKPAPPPLPDWLPERIEPIRSSYARSQYVPPDEPPVGGSPWLSPFVWFSAGLWAGGGAVKLAEWVFS